MTVTTAAAASRRFRQLIDADQFAFSMHAKARLVKYNISSRQAIRVMKGGSVIEGPYVDIGTGNWKCNMAGTSAGKHVELVLALHLENGGYCVVVTVIG